MDEEAKEKDSFLEDVCQYQKNDQWLTNCCCFHSLKHVYTLTSLYNAYRFFDKLRQR